MKYLGVYDDGGGIKFKIHQNFEDAKNPYHPPTIILIGKIVFEVPGLTKEELQEIIDNQKNPLEYIKNKYKEVYSEGEVF